jgi:hypothetical protein
MSALSPKELFIQFSNDYCDNDTTWGNRRLLWGKGAAYDFEGFTILMKSLPNSCFNHYAKNISKSKNDTYKKAFKYFVNSGKDKIALPYKFLQILDPLAYEEIQEDQYQSVAFAVRNTADLSRACHTFWESKYETNGGKSLYEWDARGATEPIYHFAKNSLAKALFFIGTNFIPHSVGSKRGNGCDHEKSQLSCLPELWSANYSCQCPPLLECPPAEKVCDIQFCCIPYEGTESCRGPASEWGSCYDKAACAGETSPTTGIFQLDNNVKDKMTIHAGYFVRKSYSGYGNFINKGDYFGAPDDTVFLKFARRNTFVDYKTPVYDTNISKFPVYREKKPSKDAVPPIKRAKHVTMVSTTEEAKDFLYNGYGVVLSTNVGFSDKRDSIGVSYPDRLWYHTLSIIGYDDTKRLHPDCLFLLANSWGDWNSGGEPDWGPIPKGSFLITESHLKCILTLPPVHKYKDCNEVDFKPCRMLDLEDINQRFNTPPTTLIGAIDTANDGFYLYKGDRSDRIRWVRLDCENKQKRYMSQRRCWQAMMEEAIATNACGDNCEPLGDCDYTQCGPNQSPWGIAFAISFDENLPYSRKDFKYSQFFNPKSREKQNTNAEQYGGS